jgi:hypothetical protein
MRYNIKFSLTEGKKKETKFEVVNEDLRYDKSAAIRLLKEKYPFKKIEIIKISQCVTALSETL